MMIKNGIQNSIAFTDKGPRKGWRTPLNIINDSEQRDEETGYGYFGARYMDHELLSSFISVDRYADKYPFISPYAYCIWNPIRLTDPSGDTVIFKTAAAKEIHNKYYNKNEKYTSTYNELNKQKNIAFVIEKRESNQKAAASYRIEGGIVEQLFPEEGEPYYEYEEVYRVEWGLPGPELGGDESHVYLEEIYHAYQILEYGSNEGTIEREIQAKEFAFSVNSAIQVTCTDSYGRQDVPTQLGVISKKDFNESCRFLKYGRKGVTIRDSWGNVMHNAVIPGAYSGFPIR